MLYLVSCCTCTKKVKGVVWMLNSIIHRHSKIKPLSDTEIQILKVATKLFLKQGFSKTTHRQIAEYSGIGLGTITYHYKLKEDMLRILVEELMDFHLDIIEDSVEKTQDPLFAYALEIAVQIALCENDDKAWDLYFSAYSHPAIFEFIKDWAAKKNFHLLKEKLPEYDMEYFKKIENITSGIELAAFTASTDRYFTLDDKISFFTDAMLKIYDIEKSEREKVVEKVISLDCEKIAKEMFDKFVKKLDGSNAKNDL